MGFGVTFDHATTLYAKLHITHVNVHSKDLAVLYQSTCLMMMMS